MKFLPSNILHFLIAFLASLLPVHARGEQATQLESIELSVDGIQREALVCAPSTARSELTPVVFIYHGHNGSASAAARDFAIEREWPEAIAVYMQGLNTPGRFIDPEGKETGWQMVPGDHGDRDLKFFDAMLAYLREHYLIDEKQVHAFGHSGGGYHVYLLWLMRDEVLASVAPMSSEAAEHLPKLKAKPVLLLAGEKDTAVRYDWVRKTMDAVRKLNGCSATGTPWTEHGTLFPSDSGTPVVEFVHPGGHEVPEGAIKTIARFFKENPKH